jgi:hypothetical protein
MGFDLDAFLGKTSELRMWKEQLPGAVVCELSGELGLVPLTGELFQELGAWLAKQDAGTGTGSSSGRKESVHRWGAKASAGTTVAYVSLAEFGDDGCDTATLWSDGKELLSGVSHRKVLAYFRNQAGFDLGNKPIDLETQRGDDAAERWAADAILKDLVGQSPAPIPALTAALHHDRANKYIQNHVREFAAKALATFGPAAKDAIPALVQVLRTEPDFGICLAVATTLAAIGADAVPALAQVLIDGEVVEREHSIYGKLLPAVTALSKMGPSARGAVSALVGALNDTNSYVREEAAEALGEIGPDARDAVPALITLLNDQSWTVRSEAAKTLHRIGKTASAAIPALQKALSDENQWVRKAASEALAHIQAAGSTP